MERKKFLAVFFVVAIISILPILEGEIEKMSNISGCTTLIMTNKFSAPTANYHIDNAYPTRIDAINISKYPFYELDIRGVEGVSGEELRLTPISLENIEEKYEQLGGIDSFLGAETSSELSAADGGKCRHYQGGSIYWHPSTGAHELHGQILEKWNELGSESGFLGYPVTDELKAPDEFGRYQMFQKGTILWSSMTGAHEMHGEILKKYKSMGAYNSALGYPKTDTYWSPDEKPLWKFWNQALLITWLGQDFLNPKSGLEGSIWWNDETGAHEAHGAIWKKWKMLGYDWTTGNPKLGHPITDELETPDGKGRYNHFTDGSIYWTQTTGAKYVRGSIKEKWKDLNWEKGVLGYPTTDEMETPDGKGRYNHFEGGSIYWSSNSGAHEVHGEIRDKFAQLGWEKSFLGYPITDELNTPVEAGKYQNFEGGGIIWHPNTGSKAYRWFDGLFIYLGESIYANPAVPEKIWSGGKWFSRDMDGDLLKDDLENKLAEYFSPYLKFDSHEMARRSFEPILLFQVTPKGCAGLTCKSPTELLIQWAHMYLYDGGYGPASWCSDEHWGDNDGGSHYELRSENGGYTWELVYVKAGGHDGDTIEWPLNSNLELWPSNDPKSHHPVIYLSAHKHHIYLNTDWDDEDSFYSSHGCNDNVDGKGASFLGDIYYHSEDAKYGNNVGEFNSHPEGYFVNCMKEFPSYVTKQQIHEVDARPSFLIGDLAGGIQFKGDQECDGQYFSAWGTESFYSQDPNIGLWMK